MQDLRIAGWGRKPLAFFNFNPDRT